MAAGGVASASSVTLNCVRDDGAGNFAFTIDAANKMVTVGRFENIPAQIGDQTITFHYYLGQLWGKTDTPEYFVTFDRGTGVFSTNAAAGANKIGKRWGPVSATSRCK